MSFFVMVVFALVFQFSQFAFTALVYWLTGRQVKVAETLSFHLVSAVILVWTVVNYLQG
jgi:hypothetical protein